MKSDERIRSLAAVPLFADCSSRELEHIAGLVDVVDLRAGRVLMREGRNGHECFVLAEGEAVVTMNGHRIAKLGPGEIVGEMAVALQEPRVATVTARTDVRAYVMTAVAFASILDHCPTVAHKVLATVAHRLREYQAA